MLIALGGTAWMREVADKINGNGPVVHAPVVHAKIVR